MAQFPEIKKSIQNYLYEEEGNITRNKLLMVGSLAVIMSVLFALDAEAGHRSHSSHSSHRSSSHSSGHGSHVSHQSHQSHQSGSGHSSHSSSTHSNHSSHSNVSAAHSNTSAAVTTPTYPEVLVPQQTHDTPSMGTLPVPAIPALPDTASGSTNGVAAAVTVDDALTQI